MVETANTNALGKCPRGRCQTSRAAPVSHKHAEEWIDG